LRSPDDHRLNARHNGPLGPTEHGQTNRWSCVRTGCTEAQDVEQSGSRVRSTRSLSAPARLVLLALVPLVGLSAVVVMAVVDRRAQMDATRTTADEVA